MNRRGFLKAGGIVAAVPAAAALPEVEPIAWQCTLHLTEIDENGMATFQLGPLSEWTPTKWAFKK